MRIYKYQPDQDGRIYLPANHKILSVQLQDNHPTVWAAVETGVDSAVNLLFWVAATGDEVRPDELEDYVTTLIGKNGLVWHIFCERPKKF